MLVSHNLWVSDLRFENRVFLIIVVSLLGFFILFHVFFPSIEEAFIAEFFAGFLGILIAFYLDRQIELRKNSKISKQILNSLFVESQSNLDLDRQFQSEIKIPKYHRIAPSSPYGAGIEVFSLFQTNAWDTFSSRLELDDIEILYDLGIVYHRLKLFNEAMKIESIGERRLSYLLRKNPDFLTKLEEDLEGLIKRLSNLKN